jgi:tagaturonate epimerase
MNVGTQGIPQRLLEELRETGANEGPVKVSASVDSDITGRRYGYWTGSSLYYLLRDSTGEQVVRCSRDDSSSRIGGTIETAGGYTFEAIPASRVEAETLWTALPHTRPEPLRHISRTIGTGDRLGLAGKGHAESFMRYRAAPVLAQQSVREMSQTGRNYRDIAVSAATGVIEAGYTGPYGFDGDHLKTIQEVGRALDAGCSMVTLDLSGFLDLRGVQSSYAQLIQLWDSQPEVVRRHWYKSYVGKSLVVDDRKYVLTAEEVQRTAVTFHKALDFVSQVSDLVAQRRSDPVDIEISVDEAGVDTTIPQHYLIVRELERRRVAFQSLAPKFVGDFEKAIDYRGDLEELRQDMHRHVLLAKELGDYRISIHSGSDKFSVFPFVEEATGGRYHLKTSGTFWLEALRTIAEFQTDAFGDIFQLALGAFDSMHALYHLSARLERIVPQESCSTNRYTDYLADSDSRQLLHVAYGAVLQNPELRHTVYGVLERKRNAYLANIRNHTARHIQSLKVPLKDEQSPDS